MTVRENLSLGLRLRKFAAQEIDRRVTWAAGMLGLTPLLDRKPKQLSGGQRQRVAMGRAMVREPKVFLFDEPLSNLDAGLRAQMRIEIGGLQRRLNTTTIYVTHDQVEAMTLGDRIVVLADGRIQQIGRPIDLLPRAGQPLRRGLHRYTHHELRGGRAARRQWRDVLHRRRHRDQRWPGENRKGKSHRAVDLGIRPEDCALITLAIRQRKPVPQAMRSPRESCWWNDSAAPATFTSTWRASATA